MTNLVPKTAHNPENGYPNPDLFDLAQRGLRLSSALSQFDQPTVLAVNGGWGSGKSFFLQCWKAHHDAGRDQNLENATLIYFDAFKHDYLDQPLLSLTQAVLGQVEKGQTSKIEKAKESLKRFAPLLGRAALNIATAGAARELGDIGDALADTLNDEAQKALDHLWSASAAQQTALEKFQTALADLATEKGRLIVIVDELDRCRPDYALRLLEVMKHAFGTAGVHFVLGVNLAELAHCVRVVYGQGFDGERYLQRFVQVEMPVRLTKDLGAGYTRNKPMANYVGSFQRNEDNALTHVIHWVSEKIPLTFRDMQRFHTLFSLVDISSGPISDASCRDAEHYKMSCLVAALTLLKVIRPSSYDALRHGRADQAELAGIFDVFPKPEGLDAWEKLDQCNKWFLAHLCYHIGHPIPDAVKNQLGMVSGGENDQTDLFNADLFEQIEAFKV
jgi:hypothetical protein